MNLLKYFSSTVSELKQVSWPTRTQTINLTITVIVLSLGVGLYVGLLDFSFTNLLKIIFN